MIRKTIIAVLTLGAVGVVVLWIARYFGGVNLETRFSMAWLETLVILCGLPAAVLLSIPILRVVSPSRILRRALPTLSPQSLLTVLRLGIALCAGSIVCALGMLYWVLPGNTCPFGFVGALIVVYGPIAAAGLGLTLLIAFVNVRRQWRWKQHLCIKCGYNLVGNVSGMCPECGTTIENSPGADPP